MKAAEFYNDALRISKELAQRDSLNAEAQWDVVVELLKVASTKGDPTALYRDALDICDTMRSKGMLATSREPICCRSPQQKAWPTQSPLRSLGGGPDAA